MNLVKSNFFIYGALVIFLILTAYFQGILLKSKETEILKLNNKLMVLNNNYNLCSVYLEKQNLKIKALSLDKNISQKPPDDVNRIKKIVIKDSSCQSQLRAYKELFSE